MDLLTGLLNRRGLEERASVELEFARRDQLSLGVIAFDIDHFKRINDEHGHDTGDRVLSRIGAILREEIRGTDIAARTGGEEFLVLLTPHDLQPLLQAADRALYRAKRTGRDRTVVALPDEFTQPQDRRLRAINSD